MGIYTDAVVKQSQAKASNTGAVVDAVGSVAITIASMGMGAWAGSAIKAGTAMAKGATTASQVAKGMAKVQLGKRVQSMAFQMIGRQIGGFSGIVIGSNMAEAYQNKVYGEDIRNMTSKMSALSGAEKATATITARKEASAKYMPRNILDRYSENNTTVQSINKALNADEVMKGGPK